MAAVEGRGVQWGALVQLQVAFWQVRPERLFLHAGSRLDGCKRGPDEGTAAPCSSRRRKAAGREDVV